MYFIDFTRLGDPQDYVSIVPGGTSSYVKDDGTVVEEVQVSAARTHEPQPWAWALGLLVLGGLLIALAR